MAEQGLSMTKSEGVENGVKELREGIRSWSNPRRRTDLITAAVFLLPSLIVFGIFTYFALGFNVYISLTDWNFVSAVKQFVGLKNYVAILRDPRLLKVFRVTFHYAIGSVIGSMSVGLLLALLLYQKIPQRNFFRTLIFSPYVTTTASIALLWVWIFQPGMGLLNYLLSLIGIKGPRWLSDPKTAMWALIIMAVWRAAGYNMVIYLAGLMNISPDYYEAAKVDGAGTLSVLRHITIPLLSPTTFFLMVTSLIGSLQVFDAPAVMTGGGPAFATTVVNYEIYMRAFTYMHAGPASALAMVLFFIVAVLTVLQVTLSRRWVVYQ